MIIGLPSLRRSAVSNDSPLTVSTVTDGTWAAATAETRTARQRRSLFIITTSSYLHKHPLSKGNIIGKSSDNSSFSEKKITEIPTEHPNN
jgi:hypothetical protein